MEEAGGREGGEESGGDHSSLISAHTPRRRRCVPCRAAPCQLACRGRVGGLRTARGLMGPAGPAQEDTLAQKQINTCQILKNKEKWCLCQHLPHGHINTSHKQASSASDIQ